MDKSRLYIGETVAYLLHRKPFLFVDQAEVSEDETQAWGTHQFTLDEPYFAGHFPGEPIVPGVVLMEMLAQTANVLLSHRAKRRVQGFLVGLEEARFNQMVRPPATVTAEVRLLRETPTGGATPGYITSFKASATLDGQRCVRGTVNIYRAD